MSSILLENQQYLNLVDFTVPAYHSVNVKSGKNFWQMFGPCQRAEKSVEHDGVSVGIYMRVSVWVSTWN